MARQKFAFALVATLMIVSARTAQAQEQTCPRAKFSDSHFHLTKLHPRGGAAPRYLNMMGTTVCRSRKLVREFTRAVVTPWPANKQAHSGTATHTRSLPRIN
jgi:hypothetical protein